MIPVLRILLIVFSFTAIFASFVFADSIPRDEQKRIIETYLYVTGHTKEKPASLAQTETDEPHVVKCGTPAVMDFVMNRGKFDRDLLQAYGLATLPSRPTGLPLSYTSPSGRFKVHYTVNGDSAVYHATTDVAPANGVPDYIDTVGIILDSAHNYTVTDLGYPEPPSDGFYPSGGDSAFDVYIYNLSAGFYGLTYTDSMSVDGIGSLRATSFMVLDNDYDSIPTYSNRPLDAVRVTVAHEYFHSVQFGIDYTEAEDYNVPAERKQYWMEMSAVWMEEQQYDGINDYYFYLPSFYNHPGRSIQQFSSGIDLHPYGSVVFPIYLSERFGRNIIREIWLKCGTYGVGASFLQATETILDSVYNVSGGGPSFAYAFREFALWNYYTGIRSSQAPAGIGYSERAFYPSIPSDSMFFFNDSTLLIPNTNPRNPDHNGAAYIIWNPDQCRTYQYDTVYSYWKCNSGGSPCTDSTLLSVRPDSIPPDTAYDFRHLENDDAFVLQFLLDTRPVGNFRYDQTWGLSVLSTVAGTDSLEISTGLVPSDRVLWLAPYDASRYKSMVFIFSPASEISGYYRVPTNPLRLGFVSYTHKGTKDTCINEYEQAKMFPYPNPAILTGQPNGIVSFAFPYENAGVKYLEVDIFSEAGEHIRTLSSEAARSIQGFYSVDWDTKNARGKEVASGVYIAVARLYVSDANRKELAEDKSKVMIVR